MPDCVMVTVSLADADGSAVAVRLGPWLLAGLAASERRVPAVSVGLTPGR